MFPPFILLNYDPIFPWYIAPLIWIMGVACLWATRYTARYYPRIGKRYYLLSALVRPLGILLIGWGWMEVLGQKLPLGRHQTLAFFTVPVVIVLGVVMAIGWRRWFVIVISLITLLYSYYFYLMAPQRMLSQFGFWGAFIFGAWAVFKLGLRQSFLFRRIEDPLVTEGPYSLVRHPQLFSAILMALFSCFGFSRNIEWKTWVMDIFGLANVILFTFVIWIMILAEERDLKLAQGTEYENYSRKVPRLFPNLWRRSWYTKCQSCEAESFGKQKQCPECQATQPLAYYSRPRTAYGCVLLLLLPSLALATGFAFLDGWAFREGGFWSQREARYNLGAIYVSQLNYLSNHGTYADKALFNGKRWDAFDLISFYPVGLNRYAYCFGKQSYIAPQSDFYSEKELLWFNTQAKALCGKLSGVSKSGFTALAIGNIDDDSDLDVWMINDQKDLTNLYDDL